MSEIARGVMGMPYEMAMGSELSRRQFYAIAREVYAENESLRKDAERYAHLKKEWQDDFLIGYLDSNVHPCGWDEVIDARMNRSPENPS